MEPGGQYLIEHKSMSDVFTLWPLGDLHIGSRACTMDKISQTVEQIKADKFSRWLGMGDYADFISYSDRRFDPDVVPDNIKVRDLGKLGMALMEQVRDILLPIKSQCIGILQGNHERKYELAKDQQNLTIWLATELETKCLGYSTIMDLIFRRSGAGSKESHSFRIFAHHGAGFATTSGGKTLRLERFMDDWPYCDIVLMAHVHEGRNEQRVRLDADRPCQEIIQKIQRGIITGSYLKTYASGTTTYGEQKGYRPVPLGAVAIKIKPHTREVSVTT